jgi:hypothetical protein
MAKAKDETRTYILDLRDGNTRKITLPATAKLTFGQIVPYSSAKNGGSTAAVPIALRIYEGSKDNLRAVMTDVVSFRDADIPILERRTTVKRQAAQKQSDKGARDVIVEARITEWVNPDAGDDDSKVPEDFLRLPAD